MKFSRIFENLNESTNVAGGLRQETFLDLIAKHKALLIQNSEGKAPFTVNDFGNFISGLGLGAYKYFGGAAPRRIIPVDAGDNLVYTANEAPPDQLIPFHHELAQVQNPPTYIFFFCDQVRII